MKNARMREACVGALTCVWSESDTDSTNLSSDVEADTHSASSPKNVQADHATGTSVLPIGEGIAAMPCAEQTTATTPFVLSTQMESV